MYSTEPKLKMMSHFAHLNWNKTGMVKINKLTIIKVNMTVSYTEDPSPKTTIHMTTVTLIVAI